MQTKTLKLFFQVDDRSEQIRYMLAHARTMCMMYEATKDRKYLQRARVDILRAQSIKECGFIRPLGVLLAA